MVLEKYFGSTLRREVRNEKLPNGAKTFPAAIVVVAKQQQPTKTPMETGRVELKNCGTAMSRDFYAMIKMINQSLT